MIRDLHICSEVECRSDRNVNGLTSIILDFQAATEIYVSQEEVTSDQLEQLYFDDRIR